MTTVFKEKCSSRGEVTKQLSSTKFLASDNPRVFHGRLYRTCPPAPVWTTHRYLYLLKRCKFISNLDLIFR